MSLGTRDLAGPGALWSLCEQHYHFDLGHVLNCAVTDAIAPHLTGALGMHHAGLWEYRLANGSLAWSGGVYDLFGLERGIAITREKALGHYSSCSFSRLERIRTHAIERRQGFTVDVEIRAASVGEQRHVRIIAAPVVDDGNVTGLHGVKLLI